METTNARTGAEGNLKGDSAGLEKEQKQPPRERKKVKAMVAMDDSEGSFYALRWALDKLFNHSTGSPTTTISTTSPTGESSPHPPPPPPSQGVDESNLVILVHVMEPLPHYAYPGGYVVESATKGHQEKNAAQILARASQLCNEQKVAAERVVFEGEPKEMICEAAEKMGVDVLVVGSRGLGQIKRALLGSVSDYCAHHATCPVVIVKLPKESPNHK